MRSVSTVNRGVCKTPRRGAWRASRCRRPAHRYPPRRDPPAGRIENSPDGTAPRSMPVPINFQPGASAAGSQMALNFSLLKRSRAARCRDRSAASSCQADSISAVGREDRSTHGYSGLSRSHAASSSALASRRSPERRVSSQTVGGIQPD